MKFQPGDKILLLHSGEKGEVLELLADGILLVSVEGTSFPVPADQVDFPYFQQFTQKPVIGPRPSPSEQIPRERNTLSEVREPGVRIAFMPIWSIAGHPDQVESLKIYLINGTPFPYRFDFRFLIRGVRDWEILNTLNPLTHFYLHDLPFEQLNDNPQFLFGFHRENPLSGKEESISRTFKPRARQIFAKLEAMRKFEDALFSFLLFESFPDMETDPFGGLDLIPDYNKPRIPVPELSPEPPAQNIDLHIEKLEPDHEGMSPFEMLSVQVLAFRKFLDLAIIHRLEYLVAIHGVGKGTLRDEIHGILRQTPEVRTFVNQYHPLYGFGATEIYLEYGAGG